MEEVTACHEDRIKNRPDSKAEENSTTFPELSCRNVAAQSRRRSWNQYPTWNDGKTAVSITLEIAFIRSLSTKAPLKKQQWHEGIAQKSWGGQT